jgi:hypothetical protein
VGIRLVRPYVIDQPFLPSFFSTTTCSSTDSRRLAGESTPLVEALFAPTCFKTSLAHPFQPLAEESTSQVEPYFGVSPFHGFRHTCKPS